MSLGHSFKMLFVLMFLLFYQNGLANDAYDLEELREYLKTNWKPPSKIKQRFTGQPAMNPLENIHIGFVRINLASDDVSGDERLEICENYQVDDQDFKRLISFYYNYVNMDEQSQIVRIQRVLRLIHHLFTININKINAINNYDKKLINEKAKSLFEQLFLTENIDGRRNLYFNYFYDTLKRGRSEPYYSRAECWSDEVGVNNNLVLMFLAFLGPHFLSKNQLYTCFRALDHRYTRKSYQRALSRGLLSENLNEYNSPQSIATQLNAAALGAETALLIGLSAMATAAFQSMNSGPGWPETLETLLTRYLPYELLPIVYDHITSLCWQEYRNRLPPVMCTVEGMQAFTQGVLGIHIDSTPALSDASSSESQDNPRDYYLGPDTGTSDTEASDTVSSDTETSDTVTSDTESSDTESSDTESSDTGASGIETSDEEPDSEHQDPSIVIQQQNELITQLRLELANQTATKEADAAGGATGGAKGCPICFKSVGDIMVLQSCGHAGFCENCARRIIDEQRDCPFCRERPLSYLRVIFMSHH